jgi:hypothetical protein
MIHKKVISVIEEKVGTAHNPLKIISKMVIVIIFKT